MLVSGKQPGSDTSGLWRKEVAFAQNISTLRAHVDEHNDLADTNSQSATHHVFSGDQPAGCNQISGCLLLRDFVFVSQINQVLIFRDKY